VNTSKDSRLVCLLRTVWIGLLVTLSGCAASNAVLKRAVDQEQTQLWAPRVQQAIWRDGVWQVSGQAWFVSSYSRDATNDWQLCVSDSLSVDPAEIAAMSCSPVEPGAVQRVMAQPISVDPWSAIVLADAISAGEMPAGHYLATTHAAPVLAGVPRQQVFRATPSGADGKVVSLHFREHRRKLITQEGNALWYGLLPLAVVTDIVIAPVQFVAYVRYVRRENMKLAPQ